jgi:hypothetical protein
MFEEEPAARFPDIEGTIENISTACMADCMK